jgi:hypothetical protein
MTEIIDGEIAPTAIADEGTTAPAAIAEEGTSAPAGTADNGDVQPDELGIGFSDAALELAADQEELAPVEVDERTAAVNGDQPLVGAVDESVLPDEVSPPSAAFGADKGVAEPGVGFNDDQLRLAEADDELDALEHHESLALDEGSAMPDEREPVSDEHEPVTDEHEAVAAQPAQVVPEDRAVGLVNQPTAAPTRKVKAAGLGGVLGAIPAPILSLLDLLPVSDAALGSISAGLTLLGSLAAAYLAREHAA